jgi:hypothetical protein
MSKKIHSQDSSFEEIWKELDEREPLTPPPSKTELDDYYASYREAALCDAFLFGEYDGFEAYKL